MQRSLLQKTQTEVKSLIIIKRSDICGDERRENENVYTTMTNYKCAYPSR